MNAWEKYGRDLYLLLLHANFLEEPESTQRRFAGLLLEAATGVADQDLDFWLCSGSWREMLTASWIVGLARRHRFEVRIREKLLSSSTCYAGQGLCFAMARFESVQAAESLRDYLARYLPVGEREYDQEWAIGALAWLDHKMGSEKANAFTRDPHLWTITAAGRALGSLDPERGIDKMTKIMTFIDEVTSP